MARNHENWMDGEEKTHLKIMPRRGSDCYEREETMMSLANNILLLRRLLYLGRGLETADTASSPSIDRRTRAVSHRPPQIIYLTAVATTRPTDQSHDQMHFRKIAYNVYRGIIIFEVPSIPPSFFTQIVAPPSIQAVPLLTCTLLPSQLTIDRSMV